MSFGLLQYSAVGLRDSFGIGYVQFGYTGFDFVSGLRFRPELDCAGCCVHAGCSKYNKLDREKTSNGADNDEITSSL